MGKVAVIVVAALVGLGALYVYVSSQPPPGVEVKGGDAGTMWISLATAVVSLLTSLVTLVIKVLEMRGSRSPAK